MLYLGSVNILQILWFHILKVAQSRSTYALISELMLKPNEAIKTIFSNLITHQFTAEIDINRYVNYDKLNTNFYFHLFLLSNLLLFNISLKLAIENKENNDLNKLSNKRLPVFLSYHSTYFALHSYLGKSLNLLWHTHFMTVTKPDNKQKRPGWPTYKNATSYCKSLRFEVFFCLITF